LSGLSQLTYNECCPTIRIGRGLHRADVALV
jgi:hypothetical protein